MLSEKCLFEQAPTQYLIRLCQLIKGKEVATQYYFIIIVELRNIRQELLIDFEFFKPEIMASPTKYNNSAKEVIF